MIDHSNQTPYGNWNMGGASQGQRGGGSDPYGYRGAPPPPEPEKPRQTKRGAGAGAALVAGMLILSLVGGTLGGSATSWWISSQALAQASAAADAQEPVPPAQPEAQPEAQPQIQSEVPPGAPAALPQPASAGGDITAVVQKAGPSVVEIRLTSRVMTFFGEQQSDSAGSGIIYSQDGYIITNNHVIEQGGEVMVRTQDGDEYPATLVGADPKTDLAVIQIEADGLTPVTFADSDSVLVGQVAVAIGNPLGTLGGSVTNGVISAKDREITIGNETMTLMQTSAAINPGNSGGGLFDGNGNLIGVVNAKSSGLDIEGLGFAIPSNTALEVARDLIEHGYVTGRPELGIKVLQVADLRTANYYGLSEFGVYIMETTRNNGLIPGDRVVSINGNAIETAAHVSEAVVSGKVGDALRFVIVRDGKTMELEVQILEQIPEALQAELSVPASGI